MALPAERLTDAAPEEIPAPRDAGDLSLRRDFHDLRVDRSDELWNAAYIGLSWAAIAGSVALFWKRRTPATAVAAMAVIASRQQAFLNVEHDALHRSLFSNRTVNDTVGLVAAAAPCGSGFRSTRAQHLRHHRLLNTPDDPDGYLHEGPHLETRKGLQRHLLEAFTGIYAVKLLKRREGWTWVDPENSRKDKRDLALVQLGLFAIFAKLTRWWTYPLLWLAPLLTVTSGVVVARNYVDHALVGDELDAYPDRRVSVDANLVEGTNLSPYNMNWHAEHHLFPWIPARRLPEASRRLATREEAPARLIRKSYTGALLQHLKSLP
ncbi:MAG TPA: fatty acid desaturase [Jatrophihabitantaceae bacterium]|nr:fatty acid desaturase [Jatrophihabitantaceae bacterium]